MCILAIAINAHPDFDFVCIHNRDECFARPTAPPEPNARIICGRDLVAGGTWLGLNSANGNLVALTNIRSRFCWAPPEPRSRGSLVQDWLEEGHLRIQRGDGSSGSIESMSGGEKKEESEDGENQEDHKDPSPSFAAASSTLGSRPFPLDGHQYAGFNMLFANLFATDFGRLRCWVISNCPPPPLPEANPDSRSLPQARLFELPNGIHCCSNAMFGDSSWPKVRWLRAALQDALAAVPHLPQEPMAEGWDLEAAVGRSIQTSLLPRLAGILSHDRPFDSLPDLSYGPHGEDHERRHQCIFVHPAGFDDDACESCLDEADHASTPGKGSKNSDDHVVPPQADLFQQMHPHNSGTRAQTVVVRSRDGILRFFYRDTDPPSFNSNSRAGSIGQESTGSGDPAQRLMGKTPAEVKVVVQRRMEGRPWLTVSVRVPSFKPQSHSSCRASPAADGWFRERAPAAWTVGAVAVVAAVALWVAKVRAQALGSGPSTSTL